MTAYLYKLCCRDRSTDTAQKKYIKKFRETSIFAGIFANCIESTDANSTIPFCRLLWTQILNLYLWTYDGWTDGRMDRWTDNFVESAMNGISITGLLKF